VAFLGRSPLPAPEAQKVALWTLANVLEDIPVGHGLRDKVLSNDKLISTLLQLPSVILSTRNNYYPHRLVLALI
jgi:hypothetical protein